VAVWQSRTLRVAVACSGLGHISRGIETWAADLTSALRRYGQPVVLFQGAGAPEAGWRETLPCARRFDPGTERWVRRLSRVGGWRFGFGSGYQAEQTTFSWRLWPRIRREFDLLHVQDPWIGLLLERLRRAGLSRPRVILAHGTEEPPRALARFGVLQHLAPCYLDEWEAHRPAEQAVFAVPNFVDTERFRPGDRKAARAEWGLPQDGLVVLCVAAIKRHHKRIDYLLREVAEFRKRSAEPVTLVVAGGREAETDEVMAEGRALLGDSVRFLEGVPRERVPSLYQVADVFALASRHEMLPIAVLEALSSGLPVACSDTPVLRWMVGPAGEPANVAEPGGLLVQLERLSSPRERERRSREARKHAEETFSEEVVIRQVLEMYRRVAEGRP
jgi:glycosyltransferase involved in cell wall biosynthesis